MQKNWIGKTEGYMMNFKIHNTNFSVKAFTTTPKRVNEISYIVVSNTHPLNEFKITSCEKITLPIADEFINLGLFAINPLNGNKIPIVSSEFNDNDSAIMGFSPLKEVEATTYLDVEKLISLKLIEKTSMCDFSIFDLLVFLDFA